MTFKFVVMFNTLNCRSEKNSLLKVGVSANKYLPLAVAPSIILQPIFHAKVPTLFDWVDEVHQLRSGCALKRSPKLHDLIAYI